MYYKALDNSLHFLSKEDIANGGEIFLPQGSIAISDSDAQALISEREKPTLEQLEAQFTDIIQQRLDDFARQRNYDGILSACTYATSAVAKFKSEGQACVNLRDATWAAAYTILANVQAGKRQMPTSIADIEADLPAAVWPA
jgi:hypothetical protein